MTDLLQSILYRYPGIEPDRRNEYHVDCPFCGKEAARGQTHFSFSAKGYNCFVCDSNGGLAKLAEHLRIDDTTIAPAPQRRPQMPQNVIPWRVTPEHTLNALTGVPVRFDAWKRYKPLTSATIDRYQLGYGRLPFCGKDNRWYDSKQAWLTVPLFEHGQLVGLRGRNLTNQGPKWISATGSAYTLWNVENVRAGDIVWLTENYVDAMWLMQVHPEWRAVAIGGATTWQRRWGEMLAERKPGRVIVALDNDLAGQASGQVYRQLCDEWQRDRPGMRIPEPNGPKIANALLERGLDAVLFKWPDKAPVKAGVDWLLGAKF